METEQQLLCAIRNGERDARRRLYDRYAGMAMAVSMRYVAHQEDARDVLQDSFIRVFTALDSFSYRGEGSLKSWVARIVANQSVDYLRRQSHFLPLDNQQNNLPEPDTEPDIGGIPPDVLTALIGKLPPGYRVVLNLYVFEQMPHSEIARQLGIKESTSASQFLRAKRLLARIIKEYLTTGKI